MEEKTQVFVYGTLKPGGRYHESYCGGFRFDVRNARIMGQLYDFPNLGYPGAVETSDSWIHGVVLTFHHPEHEVLPHLDELEDYDPRRPHHLNEYYRTVVPVFDSKNQEPVAFAWSYFMARDTVEGQGGVPLEDGYWHI